MAEQWGKDALKYIKWAAMPYATWEREIAPASKIKPTPTRWTEFTELHETYAVFCAARAAHWVPACETTPRPTDRHLESHRLDAADAPEAADRVPHEEPEVDTDLRPDSTSGDGEE